MDFTKFLTPESSKVPVLYFKSLIFFKSKFFIRYTWCTVLLMLSLLKFHKLHCKMYVPLIGIWIRIHCIRNMFGCGSTVSATCLDPDPLYPQHVWIRIHCIRNMLGFGSTVTATCLDPDPGCKISAKRNWVFATNSNLLIPWNLVVKPLIFDPRDFIFWNIYCLRHWVAKITGLLIRVCYKTKFLCEN